MRRPVAWPRVTIILFVALAPVLAGVGLYATFSRTSICSHCGCRGHSIEFQVPGTSITYWRNSRTDDSPLSEVGSRLGLYEPHEHNWRLIHGSGHGITCALGTGSNLDFTAQSDEVARFIAHTEAARGSDEARQWFCTALTDGDGKAFFSWLIHSEYPLDENVDAEHYENWRKEADLEWPKFLEQQRRQ